MSLRQVAEATKLPVRTIELLESDRVSGLPGGIYRRATVRAVAREVGLDPETVLREFADRHPEDLSLIEPATVVEAGPAPSASVRAKHSLQRALALLGATLPLLAGAAYFWYPAGGIKAAPPVAVERPVPADRQVVPVGGFIDAPTAASRDVLVTFTITSRCQLRIVSDGKELLGRIVEAGESVRVGLGDELLLMGDNAAAVQFSINGRAGRQLGAAGEPLSVRIGRDNYQGFLARY